MIPNYDQLAGREGALLTLRAEFRSALEGNPRAVAIIGEPGIGKTQLARRFRRWTLEQGAVSLYGRFYDYRGALLREVFIDLLRAAVCDRDERLAEERPAGEDLRNAIQKACGVVLPAELFVASGGGDVPAGALGDHLRFVVPICRAWLALSRTTPMAIVLDDLQWADAGSLDVIGGLMRMIEAEPLMLILLMRADEAADPAHPLRSWLEEHAARRAYTTIHSSASIRTSAAK